MCTGPRVVLAGLSSIYNPLSLSSSSVSHWKDFYTTNLPVDGHLVSWKDHLIHILLLSMTPCWRISLGVAHKLRLQDKVGVQKCPLFGNIYTIEIVNAGG